MVHVYTGNGKGKTTASLGLALRAVGQGLKVLVVQFIKKDGKSGEYKFSKRFLKNKLDIVQFGTDRFVSKDNLKKIDYEQARKGFSYAEEVLIDKKYDLVILDEVNVVLDYKLLPIERMKQLINNYPPDMELVLTGRNCPPEIISLSDYVTEMKEIKHPYNLKKKARKGIEF